MCDIHGSSVSGVARARPGREGGREGGRKGGKARKRELGGREGMRE